MAPARATARGSACTSAQAHSGAWRRARRRPRGAHPRRCAAPCANPQFEGLAFGSNAAANWGFHYKDFLDGDTREVVTIYELDATGERNWARALYNFRWPTVIDPFGVAHPTIDYPGLPVDHTKRRAIGRPRGCASPSDRISASWDWRPREADVVNSVPPSYTGGNIDNWRIGKGAYDVLPSGGAGALCRSAIRTPRRAIPELCGTAIECSLTGTFQVILHKAADLAGTTLQAVDFR